MPNDHELSTAYPPEIVEWIDTLSRPDPSNARYAARLANLLAILEAPDVMRESAHFLADTLAGINAGTRQARIDNFKNFIEEAAALPEKRRPTFYSHRIKHRFSEYRTPHQTPRNAVILSLIKRVEEIHVLSMQYRAHQEKYGTTEEARMPSTKTDGEAVETWRKLRLRRLALHYLELDNQPFTTAILRVLFQCPGETPA